MFSQLAEKGQSGSLACGHKQTYLATTWQIEGRLTGMELVRRKDEGLNKMREGFDE